MRHAYGTHASGQQSQWTVSDQTRSVSSRDGDRTMKRPAFQSGTGLNPLAKHYTLCQYTPLRFKLEAGYLTSYSLSVWHAVMETADEVG